ncbi:hypothetical protein BJY16_007132 [Actinoplanes octamycinicus]|uniref:Molecular chaperone n=1 Tax=Actinoplanes octamycinicus TaxID=135948 RepID=A0A7W7MB32_9ACTN|nr:hypothetical protein [Actinoplanes octamycinicus]MBB4743673.1 hypothetical protein [Actinoplanes octamycinicus]GIE61099.1 hypothetical protein Aoc01nite_65010 [Actinoplanes octamycinicus]
MTETYTVPDPHRRIQPPRRRVRDRRHNGLAAVDFGTSNSTVTLYDPNLPPPVLPLPADQRAVLSRAVVRLLRSEPQTDEISDLSAGQCRAEWDTLRARLGRELAGGSPEGLADALEAEEGTHQALLYDVLLALEAAQAGGTAPFAAWLADRLHRCYDEAFGTPALEHYSLFPVRLDNATLRDEVPSRLDITAVDPDLVVRLGRPLGGGAALASPLRGLKHQLDKPEFRHPLHGGARSVELEPLLGGAFAFLLDRTDEFTGAHPDRLDDAPIDHVVATYPTMAPPAVRRRLESVIGGLLGVGEVDLRYDEAIAAALFFLMRDLGANHTIGVEALRARFRAVPGAERHWIENTLVVDVGGGTTDIALITTHLHDETPPMPDAPAGSTGRHYRVVPRLRGTSGRSRRGGDFLTLQVFHLIKAMIADHLLTLPHPGGDSFPDEPETWADWQRDTTAALDPIHQTEDGRYRPGSLVAQAQLALQRDTSVAEPPTGQRSRDNVELVLGTRTAGRPDDPETAARERAFSDLWDLADDAKIGVAPDRAYGLPADIVEDIVRKVIPVPGSLPPGLGTELDPLTYEDFEAVCRPMLVEISRLAAALARTRLTGGERLDRVILTGKASRLGLAAQVVAREVQAGQGPQGRPVQVVVERKYAKNAASMGAAWAASMSSFDTAEPDEELLRQGATSVSIEVDNLLLDLPCTLSMRTPSNQNRALLKVGTPFQELPGGRLRAFATIGLLPKLLVILREVDGGQPLPWGTFRWSDLSLRHTEETGVRLDPQVWPRQIRCGIEADGGLDVHLLLWRGDRPVHRVDRTSAALRTPTPEGGFLDLDRLADRILVAGSPSAPARPALRGEPAPTRERFAGEDGMLRSALLGRIPLPPPDEDGRWAFLLHDEQGHQQLLGRLEAAPGPLVPHLASVDEDGVIRVHAGDPPLWTAESPIDVEHHPGMVYRHPLGTPKSETDDHDNPFDGTH